MWARGVEVPSHLPPPPPRLPPLPAAPPGTHPTAIRQGLRAQGQPPVPLWFRLLPGSPGARRTVRTPGTVGSPQAPALTPEGAAITAKAGACAGG